MASKSKQPKRAAGQNANYTDTRLVFTLYVVKMRQWKKLPSKCTDQAGEQCFPIEIMNTNDSNRIGHVTRM